MWGPCLPEFLARAAKNQKEKLDEAAESCTIDGESPVIESLSIKFIPSSMGHVKSRVNQRGPPRKATYSWVTDSEKVP